MDRHLTATILLIRHAAHDEAGAVLSGRRAGLELGEAGRKQAAALAARLARTSLHLVQASPLDRTRQTAEAIADAHGLAVEQHDALLEVDFGEWQGRAFAELSDDPRWQRWNSARSISKAPGGETMRAAQDRAWGHCARTALAHPDGTVAMVSHCDVIRAVIARVLGLSLDCLLQFDLDPASISRLAVGDWGGRVISVNDTAHLENA